MGEVSRQLALRLFPEHGIGASCDYYGGEFVGFVKCLKKPTPTYTCCNKSICGEPPRCAWEPVDNSDEARERRKRWLEDGGRCHDSH